MGAGASAQHLRHAANLVPRARTAGRLPTPHAPAPLAWSQECERPVDASDIGDFGKSAMPNRWPSLISLINSFQSIFLFSLRPIFGVP